MQGNKTVAHNKIEDGCTRRYPAHFLWGGLCHQQLSRWKADWPDQHKSYFITYVTPGKHYLLAQAHNKDTVRINFETGRIYFLQQGIYPVRQATILYSPMTHEDAKREIQEAVYYVYGAGKPAKGMSEKDYNEEVANSEKENREDTARYKGLLNYKGYKAAK